MIKQVQLRKFKRFANQDVPLHEQGVSFIAGGNNSGKSTLLHALAVWEFCRTVIEAEKGPEALLASSTAQGLGLGDDEFSPVNVPSLRHLWTNLAPQKAKGDSDGYTLRIACHWGDEDDFLEFGLSLANDRLFVKTTASSLQGRNVRLPRIAYLPPFAGITDREARIRGAIRRRRIGEGLAGAVLRNLLLDLFEANDAERARLRGDRSKIRDSDLKVLRNSDPWELLQAVLRSVFSAELRMTPFREEYHSYIQAHVVRGSVRGHKLTRFPTYRPRDLMVEGSGFLQWLSVYALATSPDVNTLLLDEPDAHLHTSLQTQLVDELRGLAQATGKQVLLATHSTEILRASAPERILEMSSRHGPRFLGTEVQKVALFAGLGSDYAPRIDALKSKKRLLMIEGAGDLAILKAFAAVLGRDWPDTWVDWVHKGGHKERKHLFLGLAGEIDGLEALSLRDRDDEAANSVAEDLTDKSHSPPPGFKSLKWRRRHIECYLIYPQAIAATTGVDISDVECRLRESFGLAIGASFGDAYPPDAIRDSNGKAVLASFSAEPTEVAGSFEQKLVPADIVQMLDHLCG